MDDELRTALYVRKAYANANETMFKSAVLAIESASKGQYSEAIEYAGEILSILEILKDNRDSYLRESARKINQEYTSPNPNFREIRNLKRFASKVYIRHRDLEQAIADTNSQIEEFERLGAQSE